MKKSHAILILAVVLLAIAAVVLAGCGSKKTSGSGGQQIAVYAYTRFPVSDWDPAAEANDATAMCNVYETLLSYNPDTDVFTPVLATSYSHSTDAVTWTFEIRKGVKFHDGTDLNAEAVKSSFERTMKLNVGAAWIFTPVKDFTTRGDYTLVANMKYPAPFDLIVASAFSAFVYSPTAVNTHPKGWFTEGHEAGTGPYMLQSWKANQEVVLTKFPGYWGGWQGKHFDKVLIQTVSESATKRQMIEKGDADISVDLPYEDVSALAKNPNVRVVRHPSFRGLYFMLDTQRPPLDNLKVRQALSYAFPYADAVQIALGGYATQSRGPIPAGLWGHSDSLFQYTTDLGKAQQLLSEAGYPKGGFKLRLAYVSGDEIERRSAELFKQSLAKLSIDLQVRGAPLEAILKRAQGTNPKDRQDVYVQYWWPGITSPYDFLFSLFHSADPPYYNFSYWKDTRYDKLVDRGFAESGSDRKKAAESFIEAQKILVDAAPTIFVADIESIAVTSKSFAGYKMNPAYEYEVFFYDCYRQ